MSSLSAIRRRRNRERGGAKKELGVAPTGGEEDGGEKRGRIGVVEAGIWVPMS